MFLQPTYPAVSRGIVVLWGMMGALPFGGMVWQAYHYLIALRQLGFDVWYVEDSDRWVYDVATETVSLDCAGNVALLEEHMRRIGLQDRWVFRPPGVNGQCVGATDFRGLLRLYRDADAAINLCGAQEPRAEHEALRCRIYLETDPVEAQVAVASGNREVIGSLDLYDHHFTYGENLGAPDCLVPIQRYQWRPTRPPVCAELWLSDTTRSPRDALTTIAKWSHEGKDMLLKGDGYHTKDVSWNGHVWRWSKHHEFMKVIDIPGRSPLPIEIALASAGPEDLAVLRRSGWRTRPAELLNEPNAYKDYIETSRGEFTVAKDQYVSPRSGWFSDRSVCYLAAGRPVVTQETGFSKFIPTGVGLFAYTDAAEALQGITAIAGDYYRHSSAARDLAVEYFDAKKVVGQMLSSVGLI